MEFWPAAQNKLGAQQSACKPHVGKPIKSSRANQRLKVDAFGNHVKSATGVTGDGHRTVHDTTTNDSIAGCPNVGPEHLTDHQEWLGIAKKGVPNTVKKINTSGNKYQWTFVLCEDQPPDLVPV